MKKLLSLCIVLVILILALGIQNVDAATAMYTVHFNPNGGEVTPTEKQYPAGTVLSDLPTPTRDGYNFTGWYLEDYYPANLKEAVKDGNGVEILRIGPGESHLSSLFQVGYTVVFDVTVPGANPLYIDINDNKIDPSSSDYTIEGDRVYGSIKITNTLYHDMYSFLDIDCQNHVTSYNIKEYKVYNGAPSSNPANGSTLTSDINVYAQWEQKTYHIVTFNPNNGKRPTDVSVEHNQTVARPENPKKDNYDFVGWYDNTDNEYDFTQPVSDNLILRAKYNYSGAFHSIEAQITEPTSVKDLPSELELGIEFLMYKELLLHPTLSDATVEEYLSPAGKLLFTVDSNGMLTPAEGLTEDDTISYTLTEEEKQMVAEEGFYFDSVTISFVEGIVKPSYSFTEGNGQTYTIGSSSGPRFKANGDLSKLQDVLVDKKSVSDSDMRKESGSTIVTLNTSYADKLAVGDHTITYVYDDGECTANFKVAQAAAPAVDSTPQPAPEVQQPVAAATTYTPSTGDKISSCFATLIIAILCLISSVFYEKDLRRGKHSL